LDTKIKYAGKLSFEPEHPYYKLGNKYKFTFKGLLIKKEEEHNKFGGSAK